MSWLFLLLAIMSEVTGTTCMKLSVGFTQLLPSIAMVIFYGISLTSLTFAIKKIDVSVAYAIWSGLGTVLIAIIGILWFKEPANTLKIISIGLVIMGVIGLNISGGSH
ncbi:DMT family transporter [Nostoc sp.]|uniref:DMT family transporter n=1 Tax=Nostoc sp. TaxID=1180 RepID=UPI002FFCB19D